MSSALLWEIILFASHDFTQRFPVNPFLCKVITTVLVLHPLLRFLSNGKHNGFCLIQKILGCCSHRIFSLAENNSHQMNKFNLGVLVHHLKMGTGQAGK